MAPFATPRTTADVAARCQVTVGRRDECAAAPTWPEGPKEGSRVNGARRFTVPQVASQLQAETAPLHSERRRRAALLNGRWPSPGPACRRRALEDVKKVLTDRTTSVVDVLRREFPLVRRLLRDAGRSQESDNTRLQFHLMLYTRAFRPTIGQVPDPDGWHPHGGGAGSAGGQPVWSRRASRRSLASRCLGRRRSR
jgi:hypothetical protein